MLRGVSDQTLVADGDMSGSINSSSGVLKFSDRFCIQAVWTGSPVGSIKVQASLNDTNWSDVSDSSQAVSGAGSFLWSFALQAYSFFRVVYTATSGSGTLNVTAATKGGR